MENKIVRAIKTISISLGICLIVLQLSSCQTKDTLPFDASGSFEAEEILISSETGGVLKDFRIEEGDVLHIGDTVGYVDSVQLYLRKKQLDAQIGAVMSRKPQIEIQTAALEEQLRAAEQEEVRIGKLVEAEALPRRQLDEVENNIALLKKQIEAQKSQLQTSSISLSKETEPVELQIAQIADQLKKCVLLSPVEGTVLGKFAQKNEMTTPGKPLYKIADLRELFLRAYITGDQLPLLKLNQIIQVRCDNGKRGMKEIKGKVTWISDKADFTPKTIQTQDVSVNLVYAIKVKIQNDGFYKIGMYGEIKFTP